MSHYLFIVFAMMQGCFVIGLSGYVFFYYLPKNRRMFRKTLRWAVAGMIASYILLTCATVKTAISVLYLWGDLWYWLVMGAYLIGDVCIVYLFRLAVKKHKMEHFRNEIERIMNKP